jgi:hypothetical protein
LLRHQGVSCGYPGHVASQPQIAARLHATTSSIWRTARHGLLDAAAFQAEDRFTSDEILDVA